MLGLKYIHIVKGDVGDRIYTCLRISYLSRWIGNHSQVSNHSQISFEGVSRNNES